jgi:hypothetical protein
MVTSRQGSEGVPVARDPQDAVTSGALRYATRLVIVEAAGGDYLLTWVGPGSTMSPTAAAEAHESALAMGSGTR